MSIRLTVRCAKCDGPASVDPLKGKVLRHTSRFYRKCGWSGAVLATEDVVKLIDAAQRETVQNHVRLVMDAEAERARYAAMIANAKVRIDELVKLRAKVLGEKPTRKTKVKP